MQSVVEAVGTTAQMWLLGVRANFLSGTGADACHSCRKSQEILRNHVASWHITTTKHQRVWFSISSTVDLDKINVHFLICEMRG